MGFLNDAWLAVQLYPLLSLIMGKSGIFFSHLCLLVADVFSNMVQQACVSEYVQGVRFSRTTSYFL